MVITAVVVRGEGSRSMGRSEHGIGRGRGQPRDGITGVGMMVLKTMLEVVEFVSVYDYCLRSLSIE